MAYSPTDQSSEFVNSGMRLITSPSSDALLHKSKKKRQAVESAISDANLWDPTTGPVE